MTGWRAVKVVLTSGVLVLGACSGGDGPTISADQTLGSTTSSTTSSTAAVSSSTSSSTPITTAPTSSTTTEPTTTESTEPPSLCPNDADLSDSPASSAVVEIDGDGLPDTVTTEKRGDDWFMGLRFGGGGTADLGIFDADPFGNVRVLGGVDLVGDGSEEVGIAIGSGAYTESVGFVRVRGCELLRLAFEDSSPASFLSGASAANFVGVLCAFENGGPVVVEQFEFVLVDGNADDPVLEGGFIPYTLDGDFFRAGPGDGTTLTPEELSKIALFDCGDLQL